MRRWSDHPAERRVPAVVIGGSPADVGRSRSSAMKACVVPGGQCELTERDAAGSPHRAKIVAPGIVPRGGRNLYETQVSPARIPRFACAVLGGCGAMAVRRPAA